jgi:transcription initiation factor TFIIIB Brf1 subunit/transcription initiation factor TFIIB
VIPTRCPVCSSPRVFLEYDRLLCHDCGEVSYWESWGRDEEEE